ncbi:hypothetical protein [Halobacillus litoralis]|uniref:hypothetical protein n=1 Tax=Halobacillus litoralis TaxID=45668 RepID=UPI003D69A7D5
MEKRAQLSNSTTANAFISLHYYTFKDQFIRRIDTFYNNVDEIQKLAEAILANSLRNINCWSFTVSIFRIIKILRSYDCLIKRFFLKVNGNIIENTVFCPGFSKQKLFPCIARLKEDR